MNTMCGSRLTVSIQYVNGINFRGICLERKLYLLIYICRPSQLTLYISSSIAYVTVDRVRPSTKGSTEILAHHLETSIAQIDFINR